MALKGRRRLLDRRGEARPVKQAFTAGERRCPRSLGGMPADGSDEWRAHHGVRSSTMAMVILASESRSRGRDGRVTIAGVILVSGAAVRQRMISPVSLYETGRTNFCRRVWPLTAAAAVPISLTTRGQNPWTERSLNRFLT